MSARAFYACPENSWLLVCLRALHVWACLAKCGIASIWKYKCLDSSHYQEDVRACPVAFTFTNIKSLSLINPSVVPFTSLNVVCPWITAVRKQDIINEMDNATGPSIYLFCNCGLNLCSLKPLFSVWLTSLSSKSSSYFLLGSSCIYDTGYHLFTLTTPTKMMSPYCLSGDCRVISRSNCDWHPMIKMSCIWMQILKFFLPLVSLAVAWSQLDVNQYFNSSENIRKWFGGCFLLFLTSYLKVLIFLCNCNLNGN